MTLNDERGRPNAHQYTPVMIVVVGLCSMASEIGSFGLSGVLAFRSDSVEKGTL